MTIRRSLAAQGLLLGAGLLLSAVYSGRMPEIVVTHWNFQGQPDAWGSKWTILLLMPIIQASMILLTVAVPALSPRDRRPGPIHAWIMLVIAALMVTIHAVLVLKSAGAAFDAGRAVMAVLFAFWIPLGNVLGKINPNPYSGIRTPWTLADDGVWRASHRAAGRLWFGGGLFGILLVLAGASLPLLIGYLTLLCLAPLPQSYFIARRSSSV